MALVVGGRRELVEEGLSNICWRSSVNNTKFVWGFVATKLNEVINNL